MNPRPDIDSNPQPHVDSRNPCETKGTGRAPSRRAQPTDEQARPSLVGLCRNLGTPGGTHLGSEGSVSTVADLGLDSHDADSAPPDPTNSPLLQISLSDTPGGIPPTPKGHLTMLTVDPIITMNDFIRNRLDDLTAGTGTAEPELGHRVDELLKMQELILDLRRYELDV